MPTPITILRTTRQSGTLGEVAPSGDLRTGDELLPSHELHGISWQTDVYAPRDPLRVRGEGQKLVRVVLSIHNPNLM